MPNEYYLSNRAPALQLLKGLRAQGKLSKVRAYRGTCSKSGRGAPCSRLLLSIAVFPLTRGKRLLLRIRFASSWGRRGHPESDDARALFDIFHMTPGVVVELTLQEWQLIGRAVLALEGMLQETLSYETFPERHRAFEAGACSYRWRRIGGRVPLLPSSPPSGNWAHRTTDHASLS